MTRIETVTGRGLPLRGHDIDTDRIIPARFLKVVSFEGLEAHVFADDRADPAHPFNNSAYAGARVLLVNRNFGCGSSREHAPQAIQRAGFGAIVGEGYSEIFFGNSVSLGLPCLTVDVATIERLMALVEAAPATELRVDVKNLRVEAPELSVEATMPASAHEALVSGLWDGTGLLIADFDAVREHASTLPYVTGRW
jgi:3-isopropylmalate/(R)-2-methylmalate dehydratase small subunit